MLEHLLRQKAKFDQIWTQEKTVRQVFSENFQSLEHQPRDSKLVENLKYNIEKAKNPGNKQNAVDDIQSVINISTSPVFERNCSDYRETTKFDLLY